MHGKMGKRRRDRAPSAALSAAETPLQRRNSCMFGGSFGGRRSRPETKLNLRRHFRRPNVHDRSESPASGSSLRQPKPPPQGFRRPNLPSAAEPGFCQKGRNLVHMNPLPPKTSNHAYSSTKTCIQVPRGLKTSNTPTTTLQTHKNNIHCPRHQG